VRECGDSSGKRKLNVAIVAAVRQGIERRWLEGKGELSSIALTDSTLSLSTLF